MLVMHPSHPVVSVFGSSRPREGEDEYRIAYHTGKVLAEDGFTICNGGYGGTMEASARGAKEAGGSTIGVVCSFFNPSANPYIDRTIVTEHLADRLLKLIELADAFVVLKGSTGTLLELAAVWEFENKRVIKIKPLILIGNFWTAVVETLRHELLHEGKEQAASLVQIVSSPENGAEILKRSFKKR